jgi:hypothetical protein
MCATAGQERTRGICMAAASVTWKAISLQMIVPRARVLIALLIVARVLDYLSR